MEIGNDDGWVTSGRENTNQHNWNEEGDYERRGDGDLLGEGDRKLMEELYRRVKGLEKRLDEREEGEVRRIGPGRSGQVDDVWEANRSGSWQVEERKTVWATKTTDIYPKEKMTTSKIELKEIKRGSQEDRGEGDGEKIGNDDQQCDVIRTQELIRELDEEREEEHRKCRQGGEMPMINIEFDKYMVKALVDTGAQVTAITRECYETLKERGQINEVIPIRKFKIKGAFSKKGIMIAKRARLSFKSSQIRGRCTNTSRIL